MTYTLDASALLAYLYDEKGKEKVKEAFTQKFKPLMHAVNLLEVEYKSKKKMGLDWDKVKKRLSKLRFNTVHLLGPEVMDYARHLKSTYHLSLADSIGLSTSELLETTFLTADRQELAPIQKKEGLKIEFIR